ncbi:sugar transferase [Desertivibrio insolitus]|uniref:sugar transferase n=1 Tax=Herbiconiux sp. SYSU D00978 TaxID=2812562 RepID=UPI001A96BD18|nr:sugar transferase [Herbiconiux sp. SYSU D00978]
MPERVVSAPITGPVFIQGRQETKAAVADTGPSPSWARAYGRRLLLTDLLSLAVAVSVAQLARFGLAGGALTARHSALNVEYGVVSALLFVVWAGLLWAYGSRDRSIVGSGSAEYKRVIDATLLLLALAAIVSLFLQAELARAYLLVAFPTGLLLLLASRWLWRQWLIWQRSIGKLEERTILIGSRHSAERLAEELRRNPASAYDVVGLLTPDGHHSAALAEKGLPVLGTPHVVLRALRQTGARTVIVTSSDELALDAVRDISWALDPTAHNLLVAPSLIDIGGPRISVHPVAGLPLLNVETPHFTNSRRLIKRSVDLVVSAAALVILAPVFLVLALLVRTDGGPVFFRQERVGYKGVPFHMYKFRSMVVNAEEKLVDLEHHAEERVNEVLFKMVDDPRVTRVGRTLRRFSLDELPQLLNVLKGEMSLVGPRPPLEREVEQYDERVHRKFFVKPGLTGLWQVSGRSNLSWDDSVRLDLYYVENWSLATDLIILWRTVRAVVRHEGAY